MEWISQSRILIVGLGLIGGSYAKALKRLGYHVSAIEQRESAVEYALENHIVDDAYTTVEPDVVGSADAVSGSAANSTHTAKITAEIFIVLFISSPPFRQFQWQYY